MECKYSYLTFHTQYLNITVCHILNKIRFNIKQMYKIAQLFKVQYWCESTKLYSPYSWSRMYKLVTLELGVQICTLMFIRGMYKFVQALFQSDNNCIITKAFQSTYPSTRNCHIYLQPGISRCGQGMHIMPTQYVEFLRNFDKLPYLRVFMLDELYKCFESIQH